MTPPRALAAVIGPITRSALGKSKSAIAALIADWPVVVGPEIAAAARPERLAFPRGRQDGATLTLTVAPAEALVLQHDLPRLIERINAHYGYAAVAKIKLVQAPPPPAPAARAPARPIPAGEAATIDAAVAGVEDDDLRARLAELGRALLRRGAESSTADRG
ncbi:MAG: DciA family protein [Azospirillaceae bacterium]